MGTLVGVVVGYALGTRAGEQGWTEFYDAWKVISSSDEVRDLIAGGFSVAKDLLGRGSEFVAGALNQPSDSSGLRAA
jgi:hypothetical protein